jgi:ribosome-interacting GTPase 1
MLRTTPKHKGTEHLQGDIRTRIKRLTGELAGPRKGAAPTGAALAVRPEGAAQVALVGPSNSGKSALHALLTGSHAVVGPYPIATKVPLPGMLSYRDVQLQLVDLPAVAADFIEPWMGNALASADYALKDGDVIERHW